jgi:hypothetical protein
MWTIRTNENSSTILPAMLTVSGTPFRGANVLISNLRRREGFTPEQVKNHVEIVEVDNLIIIIVTQCQRFNTANAIYEIPI